MNDCLENRALLLIHGIPPLRTIALAACGICAAWLVFFVIDPGTQRYLPSCIFHRFTGLYCPGCGATRALHQLAHFNFICAFSLNALVVLGLPFGVLLTTCRSRRHLPAWCFRALFVCIALFGVARNIPVFPFTLLAP